jgi:hypothetical protein
MNRSAKDHNEVRGFLRRFSPQRMERLRKYALHVELEKREEIEPFLTTE